MEKKRNGMGKKGGNEEKKIYKKVLVKKGKGKKGTVVVFFLTTMLYFFLCGFSEKNKGSLASLLKAQKLARGRNCENKMRHGQEM